MQKTSNLMPCSRAAFTTLFSAMLLGSSLSVLPTFADESGHSAERITSAHIGHSHRVDSLHLSALWVTIYIKKASGCYLIAL